MKETARIQILGYAGTGKTTLALIIKKALAEHGINCNITGTPFEEDFKNEEILPKAIEYMKGMTVPIQTVQINRNVFLNSDFQSSAKEFFRCRSDPNGKGLDL